MEKLIIASRKELDKTQKAIEYFCEKVESNIFGIYFSLGMEEDLLLKKIKDKNIREKIQQNNCINTNAFSLDHMLKYIDKIGQKAKFIIIDYIQLVHKDRDYEKFFSYCEKYDIDVIVVSHVKSGKEVENFIYTDIVLSLREEDDGYLKYIEKGWILTKTGEINLQTALVNASK